MTTKEVWENIDEVVEPFYEFGFESPFLDGTGNDFVLDLYYTFDFGSVCLSIQFDGTAKGFCQAAWETIGKVAHIGGVLDDLSKATCKAYSVILDEQEEA